MIRLAILLGLAGLAMTTGLLVHYGFGTILSAFAAAGFGILLASLFHIVPMMLNARGWQVLVPGERQPRFWVFMWLLWVREAINALLPVARIGGEVVSARLMMRWPVRPPRAVASLIMDLTIAIATQFVFTLLGIAILLTRTEDIATVGRIAIGLLVAIPIVGVLVLVQRIGPFGILARLVQVAFGERWAQLAGSSGRYDRAIRLYYRKPGHALACSGWQLAGWTAGAGEVWLALYFLGHPVSVLYAILIEATIQAVASAAFMVPGAIGVQEGAILMVGSLLGLPPETALALALVRRARDLILFLPALVTWQAFEGHRLLARRR